jgi:hypothetical protein
MSRTWQACRIRSCSSPLRYASSGHGSRHCRRARSWQPAPAAILTERQRVYLDRFCDQLAKYGSHRLSASIERYRDMVIELLHVPLAAQITAETGGGHG